MRKLKLDVEDLEVSSFSTEKKKPAEGTVHAHSGFSACYGDSCGNCTSYYCGTDGPDSCSFSCIWTCDSCNPYGCM
ncbi:MAG TPA: hypothetical protein VHG91_19230 [Longimicrobium sp.]|nr:hypothetical protein [Longimicrobium sp.]